MEVHFSCGWICRGEFILLDFDVNIVQLVIKSNEIAN